jgi:hypothetical protein
MSDSTEQETNNATPSGGAAVTTSPLRCFSGALISGGLAFLMYRMTIAIATAFARTPIQSTNPAVISISSAVRTLVNGMVALGTGVFGITALGLLLLGLQLSIQKLRGNAPKVISDEQNT